MDPGCTTLRTAAHPLSRRSEKGGGGGERSRQSQREGERGVCPLAADLTRAWNKPGKPRRPAADAPKRVGDLFRVLQRARQLTSSKGKLALLSTPIAPRARRTGRRHGRRSVDCGGCCTEFRISRYPSIVCLAAMACIVAGAIIKRAGYKMPSPLHPLARAHAHCESVEPDRSEKKGRPPEKGPTERVLRVGVLKLRNVSASQPEPRIGPNPSPFLIAVYMYVCPVQRSTLSTAYWSAPGSPRRRCQRDPAISRPWGAVLAACLEFLLPQSWSSWGGGYQSTLVWPTTLLICPAGRWFVGRQPFLHIAEIYKSIQSTSTGT